MQILKLLRPQQWVKNLFLFAALVFSKHLFDTTYAVRELVAFASFCLVSSAVYIFNDIADRESDRQHPLKRLRPIASGKVPVGGAVVLLAGVGALGFLLLREFPANFIATSVLYVLLNVAYSLGLKRVMIVDVFIIAAGFMLRVLAGAFAISVEVSPWLVLCTLFVSVFLAVSKRRAELLLNTSSGDFSTRPVLREYDTAFIDQMMTVTASGMAISYALYTVSERTMTVFGTENLIFTTVFVLFGIFRYLYLLRAHQTEDNPTYLILTDATLIVNVVAWFLSCVVVIYFSDLKHWLL